MNMQLFGTDGIRGRVGTPPFDQKNIIELGHAIAQWALEKYGPNPTLLFGQDSRQSGDWIVANLLSALLQYPITVSNAQIIPTPALCRLLQQSSFFDCAIMISASHNPAHDNGIKIVDRATGKLSAQDEAYITAQFGLSHAPSYQAFGRSNYFAQGAQQYAQSIVPLFEKNFLKGITIGLDCANGATYAAAPDLFRQFGANVVAINTESDGATINNNCGSQHPKSLQKLVIKHQLDMAFAFDGDGDRVVGINKDGIIKNGDDMLALLTHHPLYADQPVIVGTVMSNVGLDNFLLTQNKKLVRTSVGDKYIASYLSSHNLLLGGEQSGHIILNDYLPTGDGIVTALRVAQTVLATNNLSMETFTHFPQLIVNIPVSVKRDLKSPEIASIISDHEKLLGHGRLLVRYSGTENLLRIMVEERTNAVAQKVCASLTKSLKSYL
jgi:phosphoglucosamine mutase